MEVAAPAHQAEPSVGGGRLALASVLLALTLASCTAAGAIFAYGYYGNEPATWLAPLSSVVYLSLGFALYGLPLVAILAMHEVGHYAVMRRAGLSPSLPYFLPVPPPLSFTGTFGAVISLRERMPDRSTSLRVAASGPLVGVVVAAVVLVVGLALSGPAPAATEELHHGGVTIQTPLLYDWLASAMGVSEDANVHPLAIAGWLGLFLTSVQLLPGGQLDGGHLARALLGRAATWVGWATVAALLVMSYWFAGWAILAGIVWLTGLRRPVAAEPGPLRPLDIAIGVACLVVFAVTFVPVPLAL